MTTYPLTLYYDGSCRLCSSEVGNLVARARPGALVPVDCSPPDFDTTGMPATREEMMNLMHARDAGGAWLRGVDVFIAAYAAAEMPRVSRLLAHPWLRPHADRIYPWIVRNRYRMSALGCHKLLEFFTPRARSGCDAACATRKAGA